ncbi:MAG: prepilin-type N-terminal cleavage/methylation domain-containing protein, partial [Candidatus Limnocylindria bacterium]
MTARGRRPEQSEGFTLIEVMVALLLTSLTALLAHALLSGVMLGEEALRRGVEALDGATAARSWALEACRGLEVGTPGTLGFEGTATEVRFDSRLMGGDGWVERQAIRISVEGPGVTIRTPVVTARLADSVGAAAIDYLLDGAGEGGWVSGWSSPVSAPLAIRLRWNRGEVIDTL